MLVLKDNEGGLMHAAYSEKELMGIVPKMANRHGLIAGATGTGKTVSLQVLAEGFSEMGVPVFMADMKGDLSGIAKAGQTNKHYAKSEEALKDIVPNDAPTFAFHSFPVELFDVFAEQGNPIRVTVDDLGAQLLSRILELNDTQAGVLSIVFRVAKETDGGKMMIDLADLRAMLSYVSENAKSLTATYGNVSSASVGAIQRALLRLEEEGGDKFLSGPSFNVMDFIRTDKEGRGVVNILAADKLSNSPLLYSTFLFWMLSSLYENLPEVGDMEKPKFVFFFDEAHMLFDDAQKAVLDKIEKVVRLIRSKGVGVYFITQNPNDIPENVLGQLGNKVQHALRAYTPKDQKAIKSVAAGFRANPAFNCESALTELGTGEALVSFLDEKGAPMMVERVKMLSPAGQIGPLTEEERKAIVTSSHFYNMRANNVAKGQTASEYMEELQKKAGEASDPKAEEARRKAQEKEEAARKKEEEKALARKKKEEEAAKKKRDKWISRAWSVVRPLLLSFLRSFIMGKKR